MPTPIRDRDGALAFLRELNENVEPVGDGLRVPLDLSLGVSGGVNILFGDAVTVRLPMPFDVPLDKRKATLALIDEINPDVAPGAFVLGPQPAYELTLPRDADGSVNGMALSDALDQARMHGTTYYSHFRSLLRTKPPAPPPPKVPVGARPIELSAGERARLVEACAAEWPPFSHRLGGKLDCYERLQPWWKRHRIVDVESPLPMPAVGITVAISPFGEVKVLRGHLENLVAVARAEPPVGLTDSDQARAYADHCSSWTTDAQWGELPVATFDEIPFRQLLAPEEREQIARLRMKHAADIHPARWEATSAGFRLVEWRVSMSRLIHRELVVPPDGQLRRRDDVVADPIPVPPGKAWGQVGNRYVPVA